MRTPSSDQQLKRKLFIAATLLVVTACLAEDARKPGSPEPPQQYVDTHYPHVAGPVKVLREGDDLQVALDAAKPGSVIRLEPGAVFKGPFVLPAKNGSDWIIIRSNAANGQLPKAGERIDPTYSKQLPKLESSSGPVISAEAGAHHYRFVGIEIRPGLVELSLTGRVSKWFQQVTYAGNVSSELPVAAFLQNLVSLGSDVDSIDSLPHHIIFDRCYIHGDAVVGARRGIAMNSRHTAVIDSWLADFKEVGADSQAIGGWNGPGPFKITNNYLEGAGENIMFGGGTPRIDNLVPSDIEIRANHFTKPLEWKIDDLSYLGTPWSVKNLFELKNARRVVIDGNLFVYNWPHAQNGFAILLTVRNEDGDVPWARVQDVSFTNNVVRHVASGVNILGFDDNEHSSHQTRRILFENNLFDDVGGAWGEGRLFQLLDGTADIAIKHNTALQTGSIVTSGDGRPHENFVFSGNIVPHNAFGIIASGAGVGIDSLNRDFPDAVVRDNVISGGDPALYPEGNHFPMSLLDVGFENMAAGDYRLSEESPYREVVGNDRDAGVNFARLCDALDNAAPSPTGELSFCMPLHIHSSR